MRDRVNIDLLSMLVQLQCSTRYRKTLIKWRLRADQVITALDLGISSHSNIRNHRIVACLHSNSM